jgi:biopolymer transport protein ExbB
MLCALAALLLALERFITLTVRHHRYTKNYRALMPLIHSGKFDEVTGFCHKGCTGLTRAISEIVRYRKSGRAQTEQHVKQILLGEVPALEKRLSLVSALGATAPLLGLLGTVSGMISLFRVITETGTNDAQVLAGGISEALITTQTGLIIAIPILLIHGYLTERLEDILAHYNETVLEVFNVIFNDLPSKDA